MPVRPPVRNPPRQRQRQERQQLRPRRSRAGRHGAAGTSTFLGERYARIARRRGKAIAQVAVARSIMIIVWHLLSDPQARYRDLGHDWHASHTNRDKKIRTHLQGLRGPRPHRHHHRRRAGRLDTHPDTRHNGLTRPGTTILSRVQFKSSPHRSAAALRLAPIFLVRKEAGGLGRLPRNRPPPSARTVKRGPLGAAAGNSSKA